MSPAFKFGPEGTRDAPPTTARVRRLSWTSYCAALLCLVLVAMAMVEPFHVHRDELGKDARHCAVCHVAHAPGQPVSSTRIAVSFAAAPLLVIVDHAADHQDPDSFPLFSRPPPSV